MVAANESSWRNFWLRIEAKGAVEPVWLELQAAYTEPCRAYHNLTHIDHCLREFDNVRSLAGNELAIEGALWFHDVVCDPRARDNEERSAAMAGSVLTGAGVLSSFQESVQMLILATKHDLPPANRDAALVVDIDLSILGQDVERYQEFESQIRSEYAWVNKVDFAAGRGAVLRKFLSRASVYHHEYFIARYEAQARENMNWALTQLER